MNDDECKELQEAMESAKWGQAHTDLICHGYLETMAKLLESEENVPLATRHLLAAYLRGNIKNPDMRGKKNSTISPSDKEWIEDAIKFIYGNTEKVLLHIQAISDEQGKEPKDIRNYIELIRRNGIEKIANKFKLSIHSVRKMYSLDDIQKWAQCFAGDRNIQLQDGQEVSAETFLFGGKKTHDVMRWEALRDARMYMKHPEIFFDPLRHDEGLTR